MKLVVGLGNPGPRYADTRHNVGVRVVERFAGGLGVALGARRFDSRFAIGALGPEREPVALLVPETFMNRSGAAVEAAVAELPVKDVDHDLLVVLDDVDLPFGRLRLRASGGAGGHRGLADVLEALDTRDVPRLRFGIGRPPGGGDTADHVLDEFTAEERTALAAPLARAVRAIETTLREGIAAAMNEFNRDPDAPTSPLG